VAREVTKLVLPPLPHEPGRTPRPPETMFAPLKAGLSRDLSAADLASSTAFQGGIEAFRAGYYWEAHELWEAVWMCLPQASCERLFLQGLIQLANAGLKNRMRRPAAARRILALADKALGEAARRSDVAIMGIPQETLSGMYAQAKAEEQKKYAL
jgi:hypothetical protein